MDRATGRTDGAHLDYVSRLNRIDQMEVSSPEESDFIEYSWPMASQVGTDVGEALEKLPVPENSFFVLVAGKTHGAHQDYVRRLNRIGLIEVSSHAESDYIVVFCPIVSRVGTDVGEALEKLPVGKPTILVVMHHTFDPDKVLAESRRQVDNPNVLLTVDCLFYEGKLLKCNRNDIAWSEIQKTLGVPAYQVSDRNCSNCDLPGNSFFVLEAGTTDGAHLDYVRSLKRIGLIEVSSSAESDYIVVFCPIASPVGTDVVEALVKRPVGKPTILVVMHHTCDPDHVVAESRRQVDNPNVLLTVDCLFHEGKLLKCNQNDIAWSEIQKTLGVPASQVSDRNCSNCDLPGNSFFVLVAGKTHGAHQDYVRSLNRIGLIEVSSHAESDYIVVFCPIVSRVGTDVGEALEKLPVKKPTILVVMHHTFDPDKVVAESRRQVDNPNVFLTVDCLFYEGKLLKCNQNDIAWSEIQKALGVPASQNLRSIPGQARSYVDYCLMKKEKK